jgi:predicted nuclease with TOPRIM domain
MASKLNSEFNYRTQVIGDTVWEKIKTIKNFYEGRIRAAGLEEVGNLKTQAKEAKCEYLKAKFEEETNPTEKLRLKSEILELTAELLELEGMAPAGKEAYELNLQEIEILKNYLAELYEQAEPSRIPGYTDEQMFEANAVNEFTVMIAKELQAEIIANGRPSAAKVRNAMSSEITWNACKAIGLIPIDVPLLIGNDDPRNVELLPQPVNEEILKLAMPKE